MLTDPHHVRKQPLQFRATVGEGAAVEVARSPTEAVGDVERSLVLSESTRHRIPSPCGWAGSWPFAEHVDNGYRTLSPCDAGSDAEIAFDPLVDLLQL
jgi:hypothetical protein